MSDKFIWTVKEKHSGMRLDKALQDEFPAMTFGKIQQLCRKGQIRIDGSRCKGEKKIHAGQGIKVPPFVWAERDEGVARPKAVAYQMTRAEKRDFISWIIYEDDALLVLHKPTGLPSQAGSGHVKSADRMAVAYCADKGEYHEPKLVHRLDKMTTGVLVFAKGRQAAEKLSTAFKGRGIQKIYWALVGGRMPESEGVIDAPLLKRKENGYERMVVDAEGQKAVTEFTCLESFGKSLHLMEMFPRTGRTHQIRVHCSDILSAPILGDHKYKFHQEVVTQGMEIPDDCLFLHARKLTFMHPKEDREMTFVAPAPEHFKKIFKLFQLDEKKW